MKSQLEKADTARRAATHIVLVGGGHTHVGVLRSLIDTPEPNVRITVIAKELAAPYSGMLPGFVAGHYAVDDCHIDLVPLAKAAGAKLIHGTVNGLDRSTRCIGISGQTSVSYDIVSFDIGITPNLDPIEGAAEHALAVKPVSAFAKKWEALLKQLAAPDDAASDLHDARCVAVVGGGAAGFELALAVAHRFQTQTTGRAVDVILAAGGTLLSGQPLRARRLAQAALRDATINLIENDFVARIEPTQVIFASGRTADIDAAIVATAAKAPEWFAHTDLPLTDDGYIATRPTLQVLDDATVFAVGDCATMIASPRPKAGVFAVRQTEPLVRNLRAIARGAPPHPYEPQTRYLTILSLGGKHAIASRNGITVSGRWVWTLKDWIDRRFMKRHDCSDT